MQLQHLKQIADGLSTDDTAWEEAKEEIVKEVERLRWRLWNGKAKDVQISIDRINEVMRPVRGLRFSLNKVGVFAFRSLRERSVRWR